MIVQNGMPQIITSVQGHVGWIIISSPQRRNAMTHSMWQALPDVIGRLARDPNVRIIALRGAGEVFCAGADIAEFGTARNDPESVSAYDRLVEAAGMALSHCPKPTLALIEGPCIGGGLALAMGCDIRFCLAGARFGIPAAKLGLGYHFAGVRRLVQQAGFAATATLLYSADLFGAEQAQSLGLVQRIFAQDRAEDLYREAERFASRAPLTQTTAKAALIALSKPEISPEDEQKIEALVKACFTSQDYQEGQQAFAQKRNPVFTGR